MRKFALVLAIAGMVVATAVPAGAEGWARLGEGALESSDMNIGLTVGGTGLWLQGAWVGPVDIAIERPGTDPLETYFIDDFVLVEYELGEWQVRQEDWVFEPGDQVLVTDSDGDFKFHEVYAFGIDSIDKESRTVSGWADPYRSLVVKTFTPVECNNPDGSLVADSTGAWTYTFPDSCFTTLAGSTGHVEVHDADGDHSVIGWNTNHTQISADRFLDKIGGNGWQAGETLSVDIWRDSGGSWSAVYVGEAVADPGHGFELMIGGVFDLLTGDRVVVSGMTTGGYTSSVEVTVTNLAIAEAGIGEFSVTVDGASAGDYWLIAQAWGEDGSYAWRTQSGVTGTTFSFDTDPGAGEEGMLSGTMIGFNVDEWEPDGDGSTRVEWWADAGGGCGYPSIALFPEWDLIQFECGWAPDPGISVTVDGIEIGPFPGGDGEYSLGDGGYLATPFDLQRGQGVVATQGSTSATHTIMNLYVDGHNLASDTVWGRADPGTVVYAQVGTPEGLFSVEATAGTAGGDGLGAWNADFTDIYDLAPGIQLTAEQRSDQGETDVGIHVPNPWFAVNPVHDSVWGQEWPEGATVDITVSESSTTKCSFQADVMSWGPNPWDMGFGVGSECDIVAGDSVTVTDGTTTKDHVVTNLRDLTVDPANDVVSGFADEGSEVWVALWGTEEFDHVEYPLTANESDGSWSVDFTSDRDVTDQTGGGAWQADDDGDQTQLDFGTGGGDEGPYLHASVYGDEWIHGEWISDGSYTVTIEDDDGSCDGVAVRDGPEFHVDGFELCPKGDLEPGDRVVVTSLADDTQIVDLVLDGVVISGADIDSDTVWGFGTPDKEIRVALHEEIEGEYSEVAVRTLVTAEDGSWEVDFATAPDPSDPEGNFGTGQIYDRGVWAAQFEPNGHTESDWRLVEPHLFVNRIEDFAVLEGWPTGDPISFEVFASDAEGATRLYKESIPAPGPYYVTNTDSGLGGLDLLAGQQVVASAGSLTVAHIVTEVGIHSFDFVGDSYDGHATAAPGSVVMTGVWQETPGGPVEGFVEIDPATTEWTADFTVPVDFSATNRIDGFVAEFDAVGNATFYEFAAEYEELINTDGTATNSDGTVTIGGLEGDENVTVTESEGQVGDGYQTLGTSVDIESDAQGTVESPLSLILRIPGEDMPEGLALTDILVFKDGSEVSDCPSVLDSIDDFPCISNREWVDGDVELTVQTLSFSSWTMAFRLVDITEFSSASDPVELGTPVEASGSIDSGSTDFTAVVHWDDGACQEVDVVDGGFLTTHDYGAPGVYTPVLEVYSGSVTCADAADLEPIESAEYRYVVVFDPDGGFVTGGGWIDSPPGAFPEDPDLGGVATFGFVSKYGKHSDVPLGDTEFVFEAAGLEFYSAGYDWLVVTGSDYAMFKGEGTIGGALAPTGDPYLFRIWARDDESDTFRIKIWFEDAGAEVVVYDNGMDQVIGGGSIVVHTKK